MNALRRPRTIGSELLIHTPTQAPGQTTARAGLRRALLVALGAIALGTSGCLFGADPAPEPPVSEAAGDAKSETPTSALRPGPVPAPPRVLKWVDEDGVVRYRIDFPEDGESSAPPASPERRPAARDLAPSESLDPFGGLAGLRADAGDEISATEAAILELSAQIQRDREALKQLISQRNPVDARALPEGAMPPDARLRELAERLPRLQAELDALKRESRP